MKEHSQIEKEVLEEEDNMSEWQIDVHSFIRGLKDTTTLILAGVVLLWSIIFILLAGLIVLCVVLPTGPFWIPFFLLKKKKEAELLDDKID